MGWFGGGKKDDLNAATELDIGTSAQGAADKAVELKSEGFTVPEPEIGRIYNPYDGLGSAALDRNALKNLQIRLPESPDLLFPEDSSKKRGWSDNITFFTGMGYLSGAFAGGAMGGMAAIREKPAHGVQTAKMMRNEFLNKSGLQGRSLGNRLGCLGLLYAGTEGLTEWMLDGNLEGMYASQIIAGLSTGALYQSARGPQAALVWGGIGAAAAAAAAIGSSFTGMSI